MITKTCLGFPFDQIPGKNGFIGSVNVKIRGVKWGRLQIVDIQTTALGTAKI